MTRTRLAQLITDAIAVDRQIAELQTQLKAAKDLLIREAEFSASEHVQTDGGGHSWTAEGVDGCIARVTFPGPKLKSVISSEKTLTKLRDLAGAQFDAILDDVVVWRPMPEFRTLVHSPGRFTAAVANKIVHLCETPASASVSFEVKDSSIRKDSP